MNLADFAVGISRYKKERFLKELTEGEFRDKVVRPLFLRRNFQDGRDCCGPMEAGKDAVFLSEDPLGIVDIYAVQTKRGNLNMGKQYNNSVVEAATQLKTALETKIPFIKPKEKKLPTKAVLCVSGKVNETARNFICESVNYPHIIFQDSDDLIPMIDEYLPELWFDIDAEVMPYLRNFKKLIEQFTQLFSATELASVNISPVAASDQSFVSLHVHRYVLKTQKQRGKVIQIPKIEEFPVVGLSSRKELLILLLGGAGSGKSTALLRMCYVLCEKGISAAKQSTIPVFLRAQDIADEPSSSLLDLISATTRKVSGQRKASLKTTDLNSGNLLLCVDALDELANCKVQEDVVAKIIEFHNLYPVCKIVVTSREHGFIEKIENLSKFTEFRISPMSYKKADKIIQRLNKKNKLPTARSQEFLRRLQDVHGMELNPLLVTVFAASSEYSRQDIPANITELFKKFTEMMLGRWDNRKGLALQYQAPLKDFILTRVGFEMHRREETNIGMDEFKKLVAHELSIRGHEADVETLTEEILHRSGLFRIVNSKVEFRHLMLQEFFAGRGLPSPDLVEDLISKDWWRRALVFHFGQNPGENRLLQQLTERITAKTPPEVFCSIVTLGLALQASYLVETKKKQEILVWLINELSEVLQHYEKDVVANVPFPLHAFLNYYILARDSVAMGVLDKCKDAILEETLKAADSNRARDLCQFWIIAGLIEIGALDAAVKLLYKFTPTDKRLYLGIHLSAFLFHHVRVTSKDERHLAQMICDEVQRYLPELKKQLLKEFTSEFLEMRKDKIKALPIPQD